MGDKNTWVDHYDFDQIREMQDELRSLRTEVKRLRRILAGSPTLREAQNMAMRNLLAKLEAQKWAARWKTLAKDYRYMYRGVAKW